MLVLGRDDLRAALAPAELADVLADAFRAHADGRTRVPPRTVFRNSAGGNHPVLEAIGNRLRRWDGAAYRRLIRTYRKTEAAGRGQR